MHITWEEYQMLVNHLNQWDLEDEFNYQSDKLEKYETEIDNCFY